MTPVHIMTIDSEGEAPPIVMLERLGGNSNSFQAMVPALSGFRVVRLDFPGAGRSPKPPQEIIAIGFLVEMLESAAAHLGVQRAHVVGYSFGTLIARHLPARHPQRVTSLTLFGATARHEGMSAVANHLIGSALASAAANDNPMAVAFVRESHMRQDAEGFVRSREALGQAEKTDHWLIGCPDADRHRRRGCGRSAQCCAGTASKIGGAKTVILSRCGHWTPIEKLRSANSFRLRAWNSI
jgi:3-oxoadipate enol-lactonase